MEALLLILGLIERTVELAPEVIELIRKARAGEAVTKEEIARTEMIVNASVERWKKAQLN